MSDSGNEEDTDNDTPRSLESKSDGVDVRRRPFIKSAAVSSAVVAGLPAVSERASADIRTVSNDYLTVFIEDSTGIGTFTMKTADDQDLLFGNGDPQTSYLTVRVDGTNYVTARGGNGSAATQMDQFVSQAATVADDRSSVETKWVLPERIEVTQTITLEGEAAAFDVTVENSGQQERTVDLRYLFDYQVDHQDGAPIFVDGEVLTTETRFESPTFTTWQTYDQLPDPELTGKATVDTRPDVVDFVEWEDAVSNPYTYEHAGDPEADPSDEFYTPGEGASPASDSAGLLYWELGAIEPGEEQAATTYYGTGEPTRDGIDELDRAFVDYRDAVTGYVDAVIEAKAEGYASQYLREEHAPRIDTVEAFRDTIVKFFEYRAGIAGSEELNRRYFDGIRALTDVLPDELSVAESEALFRFSDEMFEAVSAEGTPAEARRNAQTTFENYLLGEADQNHELTVAGRTLSGLRDDFESTFDSNRQQFIRECRNGRLAAEKISAIISQLDRQTAALERLTADEVENYEDVVSAAVNGEQILSTYDTMELGAAVGGVVGGTIGLAAGALIPTIGEEPAVVAFGALKGATIGGAAGKIGGAIALPVLTGGEVGGNQWDGAFVGSDAWKAIAAFEIQWLYNLKRAPNRILPAELLNYAGTDYDTQVVTTPENMFERGCSGTVDRLDYDIVVEDVSATEVTEDDRIGDSAFASQDGTITVRNPDSNGESIVPAFLRDERAITTHTTAAESKWGFLTLPPRSNLPEIAPGETEEVPFSYVVPLQSNADYEVTFRLKATPVSTTIRSANAIVPHTVGPADAVDTTVLTEGELSEGESTAIEENIGSATRSVFNLSYPGSDLDLHLYDDEDNHVGQNYQTGRYENQIPGVTEAGPDEGAGFESITIRDASGTYRTEVVAVTTPIDGTAFSVVNAVSDSLPPTMDVRPSDVSVSGPAGSTMTDEITIRETAGSEELRGVKVTLDRLPQNSDRQIDGSRITVDRSDFTVAAGSEETITLSIDVPESAPPGQYTGEIAITASETGIRSVIDIDLRVVETETQPLENHLTVFSYSSDHSANYRFEVSGTVEESGRAGAAPADHRFVTVGDDKDEIDGSRVEGGVAGGGDAYRFAGDLESFSIDRNGDYVFAFLNGEPLDEWTAANRPHHLVITGGDADGHVVMYKFEVTGTVGQTERAHDAPVDGDLVTDDPEEVIRSQTVDGSLAGGIDAYYYAGDLTEFRIDDCDHESVRIWIDGAEVDPCTVAVESDGR